MGIHPHARLALLIAGFSIFLASDYRQLVTPFAIVAALYIALGQIGLAARFTLMVGPFVAIAAAIWFFVYFDFRWENAESTLRYVLRGDAPLFLFMRLTVATSLLFLVLRTIPDGEMVRALLAIGLPYTVATIFAAANTLVATVAETAQLSYAAMRAQGLAKPSGFAGVARLGSFVALTWSAALSEVAARAHIKWEGNRFYEQQEIAISEAPLTVTRRDTLLAAVAAAALIVFNLVVAWPWLS